MTNPTMILVRLGAFESLRHVTPIPVSAFDALCGDGPLEEKPVPGLPEGDGIWHMIDGKWVEVEP